MRRSSGTFDKAGSDAGFPRLRDADYSREGRKGREGGIEKRKFHGDDTPLLGYGGVARMWESFFNKRGVLSVMFGFAHAKAAKYGKGF